MHRHLPVAVALFAATAVSCFAIEKEDLLRRYPTLEAAAHSFGALDVNHTEEHLLLLTASFAPRPGQWGGMIDHPEEFQDEETGHIELDHAILHNGRTLANLESALRPDITVWDDPLAKISRGKMRYRIGTVHEDLRVEVFPELRDAFPGEYVWIPAFDEVYESPFALPRVAYTRVGFRRPLLHGNSARFAVSDGSTATFRIGVVRHFGDERRFLVANRGKQGLILGEMYPFANPDTNREERHYYRHEYPLDRKPQFALFNELAAYDVRRGPGDWHGPDGTETGATTPFPPADPTIVYGVRIYPRFLHHFEKRRGPVLRAETIVPGARGSEDGRTPAPDGAPAPKASPSPSVGAPQPTGATNGNITSIPPVGEGPISTGEQPPANGGFTPVPDASSSPGEAPPPPPEASGEPPPPPPAASGEPPPPPPK